MNSGDSRDTDRPLRLLTRARRVSLGITADEVCVRKRGFCCADPRIADRLEHIGSEFLYGYHAALEEESVASLAARLNSNVTAEYRGFAFEGAAMALTLMDHLGLARHSFEHFLAGPGEAHAYMLYVGAGWAFARLPWLRWRLDRTLRQFNSLLRWLAVDGYGFHEGYFHWPQSVRRQLLPTFVRGYAQRAFDQGLGRSLWFVEGADPDHIAATIASFPEDRRADLWAGAGLACTYAGGLGAAGMRHFRELSGKHAPALAQGAAFAAEARFRAGNVVEHCTQACRLLCHVSVEEAAAKTRLEMQGLPSDGEIPAYEVWRGRVQRCLANPGQDRERRWRSA